MTPGQAEQAEVELTAATEELRVARLLLDEGFSRVAATRIYYAAFHAVRAVLTVRGEHAKTHSGQLTLFERAHGPTPLLGRLLELRGEADYGTGFDRAHDELEAELEEVEALVGRCRALVEEAVGEGPDEPDPPPDH